MTTTANLLKLELKRTYAVSRERLFAAWTEPDQLVKWFGCHNSKGVSAKVEPQLGGAYHITIDRPDMGQITLCGEIRTIEPPAKLVFTFVWTGNADMESMPPTLVTVNFREVEGGSELELVHSEVPAQELCDGFKEGWTDSFDRLQGFVA